MSWSGGAGNIKAVYLSLQHTILYKKQWLKKKFYSSEVLYCRAKLHLFFMCFPFSQ